LPAAPGAQQFFNNRKINFFCTGGKQMRGRKPKPNVLKVLQGNPGKRKVKRDLQQDMIENKKSSISKINYPKWYPKKAAEFIESLKPHLIEIGTIIELDRAGLLALGLTWHRLLLCNKVLLEEEGYTIEGHRGTVVKHPLTTVLRQAESQFIRWCQEFGLSPAARVRLPAKSKIENDPFSDFIKN
jgi:P27 family predicted phage terminase small subunit